jgi:hypothetical protein
MQELLHLVVWLKVAGRRLIVTLVKVRLIQLLLLLLLKLLPLPKHVSDQESIQ